MNLKLSVVLFLLGCAVGVFGSNKLKSKPAAVVAPMEAPKAQGKASVKKVTKANGDVEESLECEAAAQAPAIPAKPRDNIMFDLDSKVSLGVKVSPIDHVWLGYKYNFKDNENIYEIGYATRIF